jgi:glycerol-3-phosphate dehydrogenase subunit B
MSSLHFSSGCVDLLGRNRLGEVVFEPFGQMQALAAACPEHPYSKIGADAVKSGLDFFVDQAKARNLDYCANGDKNHLHITALGKVRTTYLSPDGVYSPRIEEAFLNKKKVAVLNFAGFRDFYPELAAANLKKHPLFENCQITTGEIKLPELSRTGGSVRELRSIDIARHFDCAKDLGPVAEQISRLGQGAQFVALPAILGISNYKSIRKSLEDITGTIIYEVPTLPPSILGMRLDEALRSRFAELGGVLLSGERVCGGGIEKSRVFSLDLASRAKISADNFVLATGSFFSGGLASRLDSIREPVFNLKVLANQKRGNWYNPTFLSKESHPFMEYGVMTDSSLRGLDAAGRAVENLYCAGAVLAGYHPVREQSGLGVAIGTGVFAADRIIGQANNPNNS